MKIKITWPYAIIMSLVGFIVFILYFVVQTFVNPTLNHSLVSDDYYKDEIHYQDEMEQLGRSSRLETNLSLVRTSKGVELKFPSEMDLDGLSASYWFQRSDKPELDIRKTFNKGELPLNEDNSLFIDDHNFVKGKYHLRIHWQYQDSTYLLKQDLYY